MALRQLVVASLCVTMLSGCFFGGGKKSCDRREEYQRSAGGSELRVPGDLDEPNDAGKLDIPPPATAKEDAPENPCLEDPPDYFGRPLD